ncbi:MAG: DNA topoisomerase IV subunit A [Bacilli bacterium]|nr:DNA topoisomerase IV subunit A [Bacilli bacterium]
MAKTNIKDIIERFATETILHENLEDIMGDRFGRFSKYVIQERALPDVRDGLKPVQRRILFALYKLRLFNDKPYKKSARLVGEVIGKYHPHGDVAVYDALVRMSQDFKMLLPLSDIHGNNGSIDGDSAAAMRYTECRLSKYAELLLKDLGQRTVGFVPNFDDEELEPIVLPAKFPNILVNGATGIAAGYATEIPPHNPGEIIDAVIKRIDNPKSTLDDIMEIVQGPDFPTGGIVQGIEGIRSAFETGRGKIIVKAKVEIVADKQDNKIVITEIPFNVNKAALVRKMNDMIVAREVDGVRAIRDETDRTGLRVVIDVRKDVNPEYILNFLYKTTELQCSYNYNMVAISKGRPVLMGIMEILDAYVDHQKEVITNRCNFELDKAERRAHIVDGLISMVSILDAVIRTIRNSSNKRDAKENIITNYGFSDLQAEAIVNLQLYRLTNTDIFELKAEASNLDKEIKRLRNILSHESNLLKAIKAELLETKELINVERRTVVEHEIADVSVAKADLISKEDVMLLITREGYLKKMTKKAFAAIDGPTKLKDGDVISDIYEVSTTDTLLQFTDLGNYVYLPIHKIPDSKHKDFGYHVSTLIGMEAGEKVIFSCPVDKFSDDVYVLLATKYGLIKRIQLSKLEVNRYSKVLKATKLRDDDKVVSADIIKGNDAEVVILTKDGYINRYDASEISVIEPASFGVKSIELKGRPNDYVVGAKYVTEKDIVVLLTNRGNVKRMRPEEINKGKKNHVGKMCLKVVRSNMHEAVHLEVIHYKNANSNLAMYVFADNGYIPIDYTVLRIAIADNGRKMVPSELGRPHEIVICHDDNDIDYYEDK